MDPSTEEIERFLDGAVDGYLLGDVRQLKKIKVPPGETGEGSYLIVLAILVGCELLGRLAGQQQEQAVAYFWHKYMPTDYRPHGNLARALLRNYVAHAYSLPPGLIVVRGGQPGWHLHRDDIGQVYIDCLALADDFDAIYRGAREEILADSMVSRRQFGEILAAAKEHRVEFAAEIAALPLIDRRYVPQSDPGPVTWMPRDWISPGASDSPMRWPPEPEEDPGPGMASAFR
jgi:hypothetical protein